MAAPLAAWPATADDLREVQDRIAREAAAALAAAPWTVTPHFVSGGCFVAFARGEAGPGHAGDHAWAAAVAWRPSGGAARRTDRVLTGTGPGGPRRALDVLGQVVVADRVPAPYAAGLLALREGPILAAAIARLEPRPDVMLIDATGLDHPRRAGLAVHVGVALDIPTVGVTHRTLVAVGQPPPLERGRSSDLVIDGDVVARWVCTRTGARAVVAHAGWRTDAATAAAVVLTTSTDAARTPVPLQEARRVAREARALASAPGA